MSLIGLKLVCAKWLGTSIGLGYQALAHDLGIDMPIRMSTDSSAAIGVATRQGVGKIRHLETHTLWVQQHVRSGASKGNRSNKTDAFKKAMKEEVYKAFTRVALRTSVARSPRVLRNSEVSRSIIS